MFWIYGLLMLPHIPLFKLLNVLLFASFGNHLPSAISVSLLGCILSASFLLPLLVDSPDTDSYRCVKLSKSSSQTTRQELNENFCCFIIVSLQPDGVGFFRYLTDDSSIPREARVNDFSEKNERNPCKEYLSSYFPNGQTG